MYYTKAKHKIFINGNITSKTKLYIKERNWHCISNDFLLDIKTIAFHKNKLYLSKIIFLKKIFLSIDFHHIILLIKNLKE